jgi:ArsR family transcriptional regulator, lead/cadmium/zinc/bismuth-responsive transcriptional repressor
MNIREYQTIAELFQILSHPVRLQILDVLRSQASCVCHLQVVTGRPQAYVSQQLRVLRDAELVIDEKEGQNVYYRLSDEMVSVLMNEALGPVQPGKRLSECTCPKCSLDKIS